MRRLSLLSNEAFLKGLGEYFVKLLFVLDYVETMRKTGYNLFVIKSQN